MANRVIYATTFSASELVFEIEGKDEGYSLGLCNVNILALYPIEGFGRRNERSSVPLRNVGNFAEKIGANLIARSSYSGLYLICNLSDKFFSEISEIAIIPEGIR